MAVTLRRSAYPWLYWSDSGVGYLLPRETHGQPATIDLVESWTLFGGCYVVVGEPVPPAEPAQEGFAERVWAFLGTDGMTGTRFAWFAEPDEQPGPLTGPALTLDGPPGKGTAHLRSDARFPFGGLELVLTAGVAVTVATDGFTVSPATGACYLVGPDGVRLDVVDGDAALGFGDSTPAGAFQAPLRLGETAGVDDLTHLDAGFRVFFPRHGDEGQVDSHRYPLFAAADVAAGIGMAATLDPTAPLDPERTALRFTGTSAITSCYVTNAGWPFTLTPTADSALVLAPRPTDTSGRPAAACYLTPSGAFIPDRPGANLMCGISGVEYLKLPASNPSTIIFTPGRPAYASGTQAVPLSDLATTSWTDVRSAGHPITYCAQPDDATLYQPSADALGYLEVPTATLTGPVPLLPYDGVDATAAPACGELEAAAIAPARRIAVNDPTASLSTTAPADDDGGALVVGATPQGLLAQFSPDFRELAKLTLARNADGSELAFSGVPAGTAMWSVLQTNQLFLVISDPTPMRSYLRAPHTTLRADGWTFDLDPTEGAGWRPIDSDQPTFLVLKFAARSFADLAAAPGSWAQPFDFNAGDPMKASAKLQAYVGETIARAAHDPNLAWFADTVLSDPNWNGVVAINCPVPIDGWPAQLQGLAAGIDAPNLVAHHVGVQATPVATGTAGLELQDSSIFGLLEHHDSVPFPLSPAAYDFKVSRLEVLLANSHVAGFAGEVFLQVNELFGEPATCSEVVDNNLVFNGTYQSSNGEGSYAFLLAGRSHVTMASAVLQRVELDRGEFVTTAEPTGDGTIETRFQLWGTLGFHALAGFDAFSFDALPFAGLAIVMEVTPTATPGLRPDKEMAFDPGHLAFDLDGSTARPTSLYSSFPLRLTGFVPAGGGTDPIELGYAPVSTPIPAGELGGPWYGLTFQLELGSQGAWAPAGSFCAGLLVAWSPAYDGGNDANVFTGLQLPGTTGGQLELTLEGPLKLGLKHVAFEVKDGAYVLWLQSLALGFFGLSFPPGRTDLLLFAPGDGARTLGWYGVYDKGSSIQQSGGNQKQVGV